MALFVGWVAWREAPSLWKQKRRKELAVFGTLLLLAAFCFVMSLYRNKLPNPLKGIEWFYRSIGSLFGM